MILTDLMFILNENVFSDCRASTMIPLVTSVASLYPFFDNSTWSLVPAAYFLAAFVCPFSSVISSSEPSSFAILIVTSFSGASFSSTTLNDSSSYKQSQITQMSMYINFESYTCFLKQKILGEYFGGKIILVLGIIFWFSNFKCLGSFGMVRC